MKDFEEFIKKSLVKRQTPDFSRAEYLRDNSLKDFQSIIEIRDIDNPNLIIKLCYDCMMELIRARMFEEGYNSSSHECEIAYLSKLGIKESEINFADELRYFRNGILYHGTSFDKEYADKVFEFTEKMIKKIG